jgi:2-polyprenyl-6-methoxyphenol hydroxylase-like FAD-dependent oxidoreductase
MDGAVPIPIKPADGVDALFAPRRTVLDPVLEDAAVAAGAHLVRGLSVVDVVKDAGGRLRGAVVAGAGEKGREVAADWVVGADGIHSRVARLVDATVEHSGVHATATIYGYWSGLDPETGYHWHYRSGEASGAIPTNDGLTCVCAILPTAAFERERHRGLEALHEVTLRRVSPELVDAALPASRWGPLRAFAGLPGFLRRSAGPGWALVGDAGYFRDPSTAHGITDGFRDAELLARAVAGGTDAAVEEYVAVRNEVALPIMQVTDRISSLDWTLEEVKELHLALSRRMNAGLDVVRSFAAGGPVAEGAPVPRAESAA